MFTLALFISTKTGNNQDFFNRWIDKGTMGKKKGTMEKPLDEILRSNKKKGCIADTCSDQNGPQGHST